MKILLTLFVLFFSFTLKAEVILIFDENQISGKDLKEAILKIMPEDQKQLHTYAKNAKNKNAKAQTTVGKQQVWIDAQNELCESKSFNAFQLKKDWIGRLRTFKMNTDNLTYVVEISIHPDNINFKKNFYFAKYYFDTQNIVFNTELEKKVFESDIYNLIPRKKIDKTEGFFKDTFNDTASLVMFSGYFLEGKRKPHCIKSKPGGFGHGISLFNNDFYFDFESIKIIEIIENN